MTNKNDEDTRKKNIEKQIIIPDVSCASCVSVIENHFQKNYQINANVNFFNKTIDFSYPEHEWDIKKIIKELSKIGYEGFEKNSPSIAHIEEHEHNLSEHEIHINKHTHHKIKFSLRLKIEVIAAILLLIPLLLAEIPITFFDVLKNSWLQLAISTIIYFYFGRLFIKGTYKEVVKNKRFAMNSLVFIATSFAYFYSIYLISTRIIDHHNNMLFFEISSSIIVFVIIGDAISHHIQNKAVKGLENLMSLQVKSVIKIDIDNRHQTTIDSELININDYLLVPKGAKVPTDGIVIEGYSKIDESLMTGESQLVAKKIGDKVIGGTINQKSPIIIKATKIGKETVLATIIKAVEKVQAQKPQLQKIVDKITTIFTPFIILLSCSLLLIYYYFLDISFDKSITIAIATLVIACPCAMGIATPLAIAIGTNKAVKQGIIYRQSDVFEKINKISAICFDKTGTITNGKLTINHIFGNQTLLNLAINLEQYSTHPIAYAFKNYPTNIINLHLEDVEEIAGVGLKANYKKQTIMMSSLAYMQAHHYKINKRILKQINQHKNNENLIALAINQKVYTVFMLGDEIRNDAHKIIEKFHRRSVAVYMISGDNEQSTKKIAQQVGIKNYFANVKPVEKAQIVEKIQQKYNQVAFVGDGINDIVALEQANLGIAIGSGSEIAINNAQLVIMNGNLDTIYRAIVLTKKTKNNIYANLAWAFAYNLVAIPLAALGFVTPILATIAMTSSEIMVVTNSIMFKIRKYKYK